MASASFPPTARARITPPTMQARVPIASSSRSRAPRLRRFGKSSRIQTSRSWFLFPFLYFGLVPAAFAIPAAVGDFLTGLAAPFVGSAVARRRPGALGWATAWNVFGIVDLVVAPAAAILSHAQVIAFYPLALVPLFVGPPVGILTHVYSLRNLSTASDLAAARRAGLAAQPAGAA
jgi:hypothetical protein